MKVTQVLLAIMILAVAIVAPVMATNDNQQSISGKFTGRLDTIIANQHSQMDIANGTNALIMGNTETLPISSLIGIMITKQDAIIAKQDAQIALLTKQNALLRKMLKKLSN